MPTHTEIFPDLDSACWKMLPEIPMNPEEPSVSSSTSAKGNLDAQFYSYLEEKLKNAPKVDISSNETALTIIKNTPIRRQLHDTNHQS